MKDRFDIPILFIIFNRPLHTATTFEAIRVMRPARLFVAADGVREDHEGDAVNCPQCREIVQQIDWDCKVEYLFREKNLGCKHAVAGAITWFFEQVEMGIILEDDCLAEKGFFIFCETLLKHYAADENIMHIGGTNFQEHHNLLHQSYYFSRVPHVWGWASWSRAWTKYNMSIPDFSAGKLKKIFGDFHFPSVSFHYWKHVLTQVQQNKLDTWDYQWTYTIWKNKGLVITPEINMISNIGFDHTATHTTVAESPYANMPIFNMEHVSHPSAVTVDHKKDVYIFKKWFVKKTIRKKILNRIKKLFS